MQHSYDTLIVGAGPAGCAAAYDLAHAGRRVLLLDKRNFPRPKACACGLTRKTLAALRYSVDPIVERVCHEIILQQSSPDPRHRKVRVKTRMPICAMAVRETFDNFCLQQTLASGRKGGSVTLKKIESITAFHERPTHIELDITTADGPETLTAPILIGADGSNGQTRRLSLLCHGEAGSPSAQDWYTRGFALEATIPYTALPNQLPQGDQPKDLVFDFAPIPGGYGWLFPKGNHINIGIGAFAPEDLPTNPGDPSSTTVPSSAKVGSHIASSLDTRLKQVTRKLLADYTHHKLGLDITALDPQHTHITGQHLGMGGHAYIPHGRILLTGDAAGLVDPLTGEGIHSAIVSGQAAAAAILETIPTQTLSSRPDRTPPNLSSRPKRSEVERSAVPIHNDTAAAYARHLAPLQQTLAFSHRAATAFYKQPARGFRVMRLPLLRHLVLKTYADGLPYTKLLGHLAKIIA